MNTQQIYSKTMIEGNWPFGLFFHQKKNKPPLTRKEEADPCDFFIRATPFCFRWLNEKQLQQEVLAWRLHLV